jgi:hypothetical protein
MEDRRPNHGLWQGKGVSGIVARSSAGSIAGCSGEERCRQMDEAANRVNSTIRLPIIAREDPKQRLGVRLD